MSDFQKRAEEAAEEIARCLTSKYPITGVVVGSDVLATALAALRAVAGGQEAWQKYEHIVKARDNHDAEQCRKYGYALVLIIADPTIDSGKEKP